MVERAELIREIDKLPEKYIAQIFDFVEYLRQQTQKEHENEVAEYKAMAADTEREQEAQEWCGACFGPVSSR